MSKSENQSNQNNTNGIASSQQLANRETKPEVKLREVTSADQLNDKDLEHINKKFKVAENASKFLKFKNGEPKVLQFIIKSDGDETTNSPREKEVEFNGEKRTVMEFDVIDTDTGEQKILSLSMKWAMQALLFIKRKVLVLMVTKTGEMASTSYNFSKP